MDCSISWGLWYQSFNGLKILLNETLHVFDVGDIPEKAIIVDIRLPRVLLAGIVGACLSGAGVTLQGIFRNPLVDPFIL